MLTVLLATVLLTAGCGAPRIKLYPSQTDPLNEYTLQGEVEPKVLFVPLRGQISEAPREELIRTRPSLVQEVVSHLRKAEGDEDIRAVVFKIDSPGGSVTASDILYNEIKSFKERTGKKVVVAMMGVAASGAYYISLPADIIVAHPTTVTGSVGVIFLRPKVVGLMDKIGLEVDVNKSGANKDIGSPFRPATEEEEAILQDLTDRLGRRFLDLVRDHRRLTPEALGQVETARIFLADEALRLGLVDRVGYVDDAVAEARKLAGLPPNAKVIVYRRTEFPDDNFYNTATFKRGGRDVSLISVNLPDLPAELSAGFYYLWQPGWNED
jgi:protease-4